MCKYFDLILRKDNTFFEYKKSAKDLHDNFIIIIFVLNTTICPSVETGLITNRFFADYKDEVYRGVL
jgi:hypothetical protein